MFTIIFTSVSTVGMHSDTIFKSYNESFQLSFIVKSTRKTFENEIHAKKLHDFNINQRPNNSEIENKTI